VLNHNRDVGHILLCNDYFHRTNALYPAHLLWRRFRMSRKVFMRILHIFSGLMVSIFFIVQRQMPPVRFAPLFTRNALQLMLAYGVADDLVDKYLFIESTCHDSMYNFYRVVLQVFGKVYL
jgi:hypothetical protein